MRTHVTMAAASGATVRSRTEAAARPAAALASDRSPARPVVVE
jgi:hypothetical protein